VTLAYGTSGGEACSRCGVNLPKGAPCFLTSDKDPYKDPDARPYCLGCADTLKGDE
jgi:hypothetical protein